MLSLLYNHWVSLYAASAAQQGGASGRGDLRGARHATVDPAVLVIQPGRWRGAQREFEFELVGEARKLSTDNRLVKGERASDLTVRTPRVRLLDDY